MASYLKTVAISVQNLKLKMFKWKKKKFKNIDVYFSKTPLSCQGPTLCVSFPTVANRRVVCVPNRKVVLLFLFLFFILQPRPTPTLPSSDAYT